MSLHRGSTGTRILVGVVAFMAVAGLAVIRIAGSRTIAATGQVPAEQAKAAPAFEGIATWINSPPLTIGSLKGKVVLVDFWTYTCINCLRTVPGLLQLHERYRSSGLQIVGVHSPEFDFEKIESNVRSAVKRLSIPWPVAMDSSMTTWKNYRNSYWPHIYLIDREGRIRYDHIGEGDEAETEDQVRALLQEGSTEALPPRVNVAEPTFAANMTPEIYAGYERGDRRKSIRNPEGLVRDGLRTYRRPSPTALAGASTDGGFFLDGTWIARREFLEARSSAKIVLPLYAKHVYVTAASDPPTTVALTLDGKLLTKGTGIAISGSRLYPLVSLPSAGRHILELDVQSGFQVFTFTFG